MADLGSIMLSLALALAAYAVVGSILGKVRNVPPLVESARNATYLLVLVIAVAVVSLIGAFLSNDFQVQYVALHSSLDMPRIYTWVAFYAGNEGSLLYIAFALSVMVAVAVFFGSRKALDSLPYTTAVPYGSADLLPGGDDFFGQPFHQALLHSRRRPGHQPPAHPPGHVHPPADYDGRADSGQPALRFRSRPSSGRENG